MRFWRIVGGLAALSFFLASVAAGAELTYSGVPGKWKRGVKGAKDKATEVETPGPGKEKEKGKRTKTVPAPSVTVPMPQGGAPVKK